MILRGRRVVTPEGLQPRAIHIEGERIESVTAWDDVPRGIALVDAGEAAILPGLVDTHVHINEPGRADWEGFETATRAAAAGGVTTMIEMPLNSIPATTTVESLELKVESARGKLSVDVGFWGGVVPGNVRELEPLWQAGVFGFKCFLVPSGVDEFRHVARADLEQVMPLLATLGAPLLVHAELPELIERAEEIESCTAWDGRSYACYEATRPPESELAAIAMMIELARKTGARVHIVHVSAGGAVFILGEVRDAGLGVTAETCPHYLTLCAEEIPDGACEFKCAPPIRERANRELLWEGLRGGRLDMVVTDHSPCPPALKKLEQGDFATAWGGIASIQLGLSVTWSGASGRGFGLTDVARWMSAAPAKLAGLEARKGAIAAGYDADLVVFDPEAEFVVDPAKLYHRHAVTPYAGRRLRGVVQQTWLRGALVFDRGSFGDRRGRVLKRHQVRM